MKIQPLNINKTFNFADEFELYSIMASYNMLYTHSKRNGNDLRIW